MPQIAIGEIHGSTIGSLYYSKLVCNLDCSKLASVVAVHPLACVVVQVVFVLQYVHINGNCLFTSC